MVVDFLDDEGVAALFGHGHAHTHAHIVAHKHGLALIFSECQPHHRTVPL